MSNKQKTLELLTAWEEKVESYGFDSEEALAINDELEEMIESGETTRAMIADLEKSNGIPTKHDLY